jgi:hypothetical protein
MTAIYWITKICGGVRGALLALALTLSLGALGVQTYRVNAEQRAHAASLAEAEKQRVMQWMVFADAQSKYHAALNKTRGEYVAKLEEAQTQLAAAQRRIAAGSVLPRFKCPAPAVTGSGSATGSDGGEERGLLDADGDFLVRLASEADRNTNQLKAAQDTITALQLKCGGTDG